MARMHSRKQGKSGSTKPQKKVAPLWLQYKPKEIELIIGRLAKEGKSAAEIGILLRDSYGIPDVKSVLKKTVAAVVKEQGAAQELPDDLMSLIRRSVALRKHLEANHKDETAKRGLLLTESKIKRLTKYYKKAGTLESAWKFDPQRAGFFMK